MKIEIQNKKLAIAIALIAIIAVAGAYTFANELVLNFGAPATDILPGRTVGHSSADVVVNVDDAGTGAGACAGDMSLQDAIDNGCIGKTAQNLAAGKTVTASNWGQTTPANLGNAVDSDEATSTTEGVTRNVGNEGFVTIDLGNSYKGIVFAKIGARAVTGSSGQWRIWSSADNAKWIINWESQRQWPGATEAIWYPAVSFWGRYIRISALDIGDGQMGLKVYEVYAIPSK